MNFYFRFYALSTIKNRQHKKTNPKTNYPGISAVSPFKSLGSCLDNALIKCNINLEE